MVFNTISAGAAGLPSFFTAAFLLLTPNLSITSTLEHTDRLSSTTLVAQVLKHNAGLNARALQAQAATQQIGTVGVFDDPIVNYSLAPNTIDSNGGTRHLFSISQSIPWPGKRALESQIAQEQAKIVQYTHDEWRLYLIFHSRNLWAQWWFVHRALTINQINQKLLEELLTVVETQYSNGLGLQQDLLQVQTSKIHLHHQSIVLSQQAKRIKIQINALLNQSPSATVPKPNQLHNMPSLPQAQTLQDAMIQANPKLLGINAKKTAATTHINLIKKNDYPNLRLTADYNELRDNNDRRLQVGVNMTIPFDFGKRSAAKSAANYNYHSTRYELQELRTKLIAQLEEQLSLAQEANHVIGLYSGKLIPKSEQTLDAARADYEAGRGEFGNVIRAEQQLLSAQLEFARNQSQLFIAIAELDQLSGGTLWPVTTGGK